MFSALFTELKNEEGYFLSIFCLSFFSICARRPLRERVINVHQLLCYENASFKTCILQLQKWAKNRHLIWINIHTLGGNISKICNVRKTDCSKIKTGNFSLTLVRKSLALNSGWRGFSFRRHRRHFFGSAVVLWEELSVFKFVCCKRKICFLIFVSMILVYFGEKILSTEEC